MYQIYCDNNLLYDIRHEEFFVENPTLTYEISRASCLTFDIYADHPYYNRLNKLTSIIKVLKDGKCVFIGRIISEEQSFYNQKYVECESAFAFLNDSVYRPFSFDGTPANLFGNILDNHNLQVEDNQKIRVGNVKITDSNNRITCSSANYLSSYEMLNTRLLTDLGGYLIERYVNGVVYLDYLENAAKTAKQNIQFGENLLDIISKNDATETYSVVIPLGCQIEEQVDEEGNVIEEAHRLTIESVNDGKDFLVNEEAFNQYGWIVAPTSETTWDDETVATNLYNKGKQYLNNQAVMMKNTIELTALDLSTTDVDIEGFELGQSIRLYSKPHNFDKEYLLKKMVIPFDSPQNMTVSLGDTANTLTGIQLGDKQKVDETIERVEIINADYVKNKQLTAIKNETIKTATSIIQDNEKVMMEAIELIETNLQSQIDEIETLSIKLSVNLSTIQVYDYDTNLYTPNYTQQHLIITPIIQLGDTKIDANNCTIKWLKNSEQISVDKTLIINENLSANTMLYRCCVIYENGNRTYNDEEVINLTLVKNGKTGTDGENGQDGISISKVTEYYLVSSLSIGVTTSTSGWSTTIPLMTTTNKYLWNYEVITYSNNSTTTLTPKVIGVYGNTGATGSDGSDGKGISNITNYYLANASLSGVTTATSGWTTTIQTITTTLKYLWNYEKITYTDNSTTTTTPVIIGAYGNTGATGNTGASGIGITGITTEFYLSPSKTAQSGGSWSATMPVWKIGYYLWTRLKTTYTDNTTTYTTPLCDSSWEAVNEIEVGGRNYIPLSSLRTTESLNTFTKDHILTLVDDEYVIVEKTIVTTIRSGFHKVVDLSKYLKLGDTVTFSVDMYIESLGEGSQNGSVFVRTYKASATNTILKDILSTNIDASMPKNQWMKLSKTAKIEDEDFYFSKLHFICYLGYGQAKIRLKNMKLEIGNKATDWTPAPEDLQLPQCKITSSITAFTTVDNASYTPASIALTPELHNCNYNIWQYSTNGGVSWISVTSGSNGLTINSTTKVLTIVNSSVLFDTNKNVSFRLASDVTNIADTITISRPAFVPDDLQNQLINIDSNLELSQTQISTVSSNLQLLKNSFNTEVAQSWQAIFGEEYQLLKDTIASLELTISQFAVNFTNIAKVTNSIGETVSDEISKYMRFNSAGQLIIGSSDSIYQVRIDNDSFDILNGGNQVATFSQSMLIGQNANFSDNVQTGDVIMQSYTNGLVFKWGGS